MFTQAWKKHLPVITLFMKKAAAGDQVLDLNVMDFQRAAGGKKVKCVFTGVQLTNGVLNNASLHAPVAAEFARILQENGQTEQLLRGRRFEFSLTSKFQLTVKNTTEAGPVITASADDDLMEPLPETVTEALTEPVLEQE